MDRKKKTASRANASDRIGALSKPTIQMSGQSYTTPVNTGHRNHPVQKIVSASGNTNQPFDSTPVNARQQIPKTPGIIRQPANRTPDNARQQTNQTPHSSNSQQNYTTPESGLQDYSTPSQQDYTTPGNSRHQDNNLSFDETYEQQVHGIVDPSNCQTANEALRAVSHNIEKLRGLVRQVEVRVHQVKEDIDEIRSRVEEALLLPQQQEARIDMVQQLKEIKSLEDELYEQKLMMRMVERQLHEHIENQKELELAECNFQMKKRQFEGELQKNREDFQKQQRYRDESYQQQQQKMEHQSSQQNDTIAEIAKAMPEVNEIERMAEKAVAAEETAAEAPVRDTENQRKTEGIPKVRFRGDGNEMNK